jgi:hypothetical protein
LDTKLTGCRTLASLGAAIVLLSLPLDLCYQQIVRYPTTQVLDQSVDATINRAILYDPGSEQQWRMTDWSIFEDSQIAAFLTPSWVAKSSVGPGVGFACPTGNCTYEPFHTLAFDFECKALSSDFLVRDCRNTSAEWHSSIPYEGPTNITYMTSCGYFLDVPDSVSQLMSGY